MSVWVCSKCFSINPPRHDNCYSCRADRPDGAAGQQDASGPRQQLVPDADWRQTLGDNPQAQPGFLYTGVVLRGFAFVVDMLLLAACAVAVVLGLGSIANGLAAVVVITATPLIYFVVGWGEFGTTVGMRLLRLRIVRAKDGTTIGYGRAVVRLFVFVAAFLLAPAFIVLVTIAIDRKRRGVHDHAAGSVVIRPVRGRLEVPASRAPGLASANP